MTTITVNMLKAESARLRRQANRIDELVAELEADAESKPTVSFDARGYSTINAIKRVLEMYGIPMNAREISQVLEACQRPVTCRHVSSTLSRCRSQFEKVGNCKWQLASTDCSIDSRPENQVFQPHV